MTLTDERRKALMKYLGDGVDRSFTTDADMMALFRKIKDSKKFSSFWHFAVDKDRDAVELDCLFYDAERFCNLVAEWLEVKK